MVQGKTARSRRSSSALYFWEQWAGSASPMQPELWAAQSHQPLRVWELSAPLSKLLALARLCSLVEVLSKQGRTEASHKGLQAWATCSLQNPIASFYQNLHKAWCIFGFASLSCSSSDCNDTPGLKSPVLRGLLPLLWKAPTTSSRRPQSFLYSTSLDQMWDNSITSSPKRIKKGKKKSDAENQQENSWGSKA